MPVFDSAGRYILFFQPSFFIKISRFKNYMFFLLFYMFKLLFLKTFLKWGKASFLYILPSFFQKYVFPSLILLFSQTFNTSCRTKCMVGCFYFDDGTQWTALGLTCSKRSLSNFIIISIAVDRFWPKKSAFDEKIACH